jgi:phosphoglycolate phosphatase
MAIQTLIFDWDGTLHNTKALYGNAFRCAYQWLVAEGYAPAHDYTDDEVSGYLGMNAKVMWNTFMPQLPQPVKEQASDIIGRHMVDGIRSGKAVLYPGALETLAALKQAGYRLVFLSNCKVAYLDAHREVFELDRYFDGFYCCQQFDFIPKKDIFPHIQADFPGGFLMIGDRYSDLETAYTHHFPAIGCSYGFGTPEEWKNADHVASDVTELPRLVSELN